MIKVLSFSIIVTSIGILVTLFIITYAESGKVSIDCVGAQRDQINPQKVLSIGFGDISN
jgi:sugar phosphate permease